MRMPSGLKTNLLILLVSAALWFGAYHLNGWLMSFAVHVPGISLIFLPSGIRLLALMTGGVWAAAGITLGAFLCMDSEFTRISMMQAATLSLAAGFGGYLSLLATCRLLGISPHLANLMPVHLPLMALGTAIGSAALHNALYTLYGMAQWREYIEHVAAMAAGDVIGSLLAILLLMAGLRLYRKSGFPA
jgi:hypothetical protein